MRNESFMSMVRGVERCMEDTQGGVCMSRTGASRAVVDFSVADLAKAIDFILV